MYFPGLIIAKVSWNLAATLTLAEWCSAQAWNRDGRCVSCGHTWALGGTVGNGNECPWACCFGQRSIVWFHGLYLTGKSI